MSYTKPRPHLLIALASASMIALAAASVPAQKQRPARPGAARAKPPAAQIAEQTALLQGTDVEAAVKAAGSLGTIKEPLALDALMSALALGLHPRVAAAALDAVAQHGDVRSYETLRFFLHYRDPRVRAAAVRAVGKLDDPRAAGHAIVALSDTDKTVRAAAIEIIAVRQWRPGIEPMLELLKKGDEAAAPALATLATPDLARALGELIGVAPDFLLARALGLTLRRQDFGPETALVQVVRTLGKVPGQEALDQLQRYVESVPANPPRQSRREAEALIKARATQGQPGAETPGAQPGGAQPGGAQPGGAQPGGAQPGDTSP
jgi:HEAT repeat protein